MRPETYSSLKAVDGAWRVAMGYLHRRPIDVRTQRCPGCGRELNVEGMGEGPEVECRACHARTRLPGYVVGEVWQQRAAEGAWEMTEPVEGWEEWDRRRRWPRVCRVVALVVLVIVGFVTLMLIWQAVGIIRAS